MLTILSIIHVITAILLILIVLLQVGKSAGLESIFGGGGERLFSLPSGTAFLRKVTITLAVIFILTSLVITSVINRAKMSSVVMREIQTQR